MKKKKLTFNTMLLAVFEETISVDISFFCSIFIFFASRYFLYRSCDGNIVIKIPDIEIKNPAK